MRTNRIAVDLFAGCGGITLGADLAGFEVGLAVEKSAMAAETHFRNFHLRDRRTWLQEDGDGRPTAEQLEWERHLALSSSTAQRDLRAQAKAGLVVGDIREVVTHDDILSDLADPRPALVAGGPPCQGFSMAGRRRANDARNELPWAFLDVVDQLNPRAVLVENVVGISRAFQRHGTEEEPPFEQLAVALSDQSDGYVVQRLEVNARHFGVAQSRPRMMLVALARDVASALDVHTDGQVWRSAPAFASGNPEVYEHQLSLIPPLGGLYTGAERWTEIGAGSVLQDLIGSGPELDLRPAHEDGFYEHEPLTRWLRSWRPPDVDYEPPLTNQRPRQHSEVVTQRFKLYHHLRRIGVDAGMVRRASQGSRNEALTRVRDILREQGTPLSAAGLEFKEARDHDLADVIVRMATRKHSQRALDPEVPAPTVMTLPDDHVHPYLPRVMTVRELARIQSFPDWFEFRSKETTGGSRRRVEVPQYSQVGNAVPPVMAWRVLDHIRWLLDQHDLMRNMRRLP